MILIDSSAWIEFLRGKSSTTRSIVNELLEHRHEVATCDAVRMELLAGEQNRKGFYNLWRLLTRATVIPTQPKDYDNAAALYRQCRLQGKTVRGLIDCLIASIAIRAGVPILHNDTDFDVLARHTGLQIYKPAHP